MTAAAPATPRIVVTGATGFIGAQVLAELTGRGVEVHAVSRAPPRGGPEAGVVWHRIDLLETVPASILEAIRPSHCLHLAWEATPGRYRTARENYDWVAASVRFARAFHLAGGRSFTLAGSCAEYALPSAVCDEFGTPLADDCAYAVCKAATARLLAALARDTGARFNAGRIFYIYGPGEPAGKLVASICRALAAGQAIPLTSGDDVVDYIFAADVARALVRLALSDLAGPVNIGSGQGARVRDIATRLGEIAGRPELLQFGKLELGREPVRIVAATTRLTRELGVEPQVTLDQGLRACYAACQAASPAV
jgi:nucleoside-diphosphate-sugar epimerase